MLYRTSFGIFLFNAFVSFSQEAADDTSEFIFPDKIGRHEIGYLLLGVNLESAYVMSRPGKPMYEFLNEVMYRYKFGTISMRMHAAYFSREKIRNAAENIEESIIKEPCIGAGIQYNPIGKKDWIYFYADAGYRRRKESTRFKSYYTDELREISRSSVMDAFDLTPGIGSKIRIYGSLHFTADIGYNFMLGKRTSNSIWNPELTYSQTNESYRFETWTAKMGLSLTFD